jgi:hypothetical protein
VEIREGIDDYRYWLTLRQVLQAGGNPGSPAAVRARRLLAEMQAATAEVASPSAPTWSGPRYASFRSRLARSIQALEGAP